MENILNFILDQEGLETVEYALLMGLLTTGVIGLVLALGLWVQEQFQLPLGGS